MRTQRELDCIKTQLVGAALSARERGLQLRQGNFGDGERSCCLVTALVKPERGPDSSGVDAAFNKAAKELGVTGDELWSLIYGYDSGGFFQPFYADKPELYALGHDIAVELGLS